MAIQIFITVKGLKRFKDRARKIRKFIANPLSTDIISKVDAHMVRIARNRKDQIEALGGHAKRTIKNKTYRSSKGALRTTYKGTERPSRTSNIKKYGRDTGTLFTDLFKASLKPGSENDILRKKIFTTGAKDIFTSYTWDYLEEDQPNDQARIMRKRIVSRTGYFLFNQGDKQSITILLSNLIKAKIR